MTEAEKAKLVSLQGQCLTWKLLAELGIDRPTETLITKIYQPCTRCKKKLGNYAKGLCRSCYQTNRYRPVNVQGQLVSVYGRPVCYYCENPEENTAQIPGTEKWVCCEHDTAAKREAFLTITK